jgi:Domain of unknown function (DUF4157)
MLHAPTSETKPQSHPSPSQAIAGPDSSARAPVTAGYAPRQAVSSLPAASPMRSQQQLARLHSTYGNQAVLRMLSQSAPVIQTKLAVNKAGDEFEQEADRVADQVMRMTAPVPSIQRKCSSCAAEEEKVQRKCAECEEEEKQTGLQRKEADASPQFAPPSVHDVLNSPGQPLDPGTRAFMEPRFGYDFSGVRVHRDAKAAGSAAAVNALAYTVGRSVVFGVGQYAPQSNSGRRLIAHELAHVIQQGKARVESRSALSCTREGSETAAGRTFTHSMPHAAPLGISRQPVPTVDPPVPTVDPAQQIRQWLQQHEFAPPREQPGEGERHVLLNGEEMPVSQAVRLAAAETHQSEEDIRRVIDAELGRAWPESARGATFVGGGNLVPGLPLVPQSHEDEVRLAKANELMRVDDWLDEHHFYQPVIPDRRGAHVILDGNDVTIEEVADRVMAMLGGAGAPRMSYVTREEVLVHLRRRYVAAPSAPSTQMVVGYTLVPRGLQALTGAPDPLNPLRTQHQFSFTVTWAHHPGDSGGFETSVQGSVTLDDLGNIVNVQAGGQEALVTSLLDGWIQVSGFVQLMGSANWSMTATGTAHVSPGLQVAVGAQVLLTPQLGRHLDLFGGVLAVAPPQIGVQALGGAALTDQGVQGGGSVGIVINIPFDLDFTHHSR